MSVTVAPNAKITFELVYQELLRRRLGTYELLLKVKPQQLVKHLQVSGTALSRKLPRFPFPAKAASPCFLASWGHSLPHGSPGDPYLACFQMDIHIFEPQGIRLLETESTFMTQELADALTTSQNKTKVGLL